MIPRITHQTAARIPQDDDACRQQLLALHPAWTHVVYDDEACRDAIRCELPYLLPLYDSFAHPVQRADLFRVAAVYLWGGFYLDTDVMCRRALDPLLEERCVLGEERTLSADQARMLGHEHTMRVANYMFASEPRHPFWIDVLDAMVARSRAVRSENDILESTGPGLLTSVFHEAASDKAGVTLLRNSSGRCSVCGDACCQFGEYASHQHRGSWRWQDARNGMTVQPRVERVQHHPHVRSLLGLERGAPATPDPVYILKTYDGSQMDGLSAAYAQMRAIGRECDDTRRVAGGRVFVCGVPFLYTDRLSPHNTNILLTMFESSRLPDAWVQSINSAYHGCVVPHEYVRRVFLASGVRVPVAVNALGFTRYRRVPRAPDGTFRVGFLGVPVRRKNLRRLFAACGRLRERVPTLRLAVHVSHFYDWLDARAFDDMRQSPFVEWSEGVLDDVAVASWYSRLSCYAYPSSGEGWSFTPREAMFLGIPTAVSDIPVHEELIASGCVTPIEAGATQPAQFDAGVFGEWREISARAIEEAVWRLYQNDEEGLRLADKASRWIEGKWLNADTRRRMVDLLARVPA
jgi:glycosyltransferase involved in cell wall biosynthesis